MLSLILFLLFTSVIGGAINIGPLASYYDCSYSVPNQNTKITVSFDSNNGPISMCIEKPKDNCLSTFPMYNKRVSVNNEVSYITNAAPSSGYCVHLFNDNSLATTFVTYTIIFEEGIAPPEEEKKEFYKETWFVTTVIVVPLFILSVFFVVRYLLINKRRNEEIIVPTLV